MSGPADKGFRPGDRLARVAGSPITREMLRQYAVASGDLNPVHTDPETARRGGQDDVIGHGMLAMALLGRALTEAVPQQSLRSFSTRFLRPIQLGEVLISTVEVDAVEPGEKPVLRLRLTCEVEGGEPCLSGSALVVLEE